MTDSETSTGSSHTLSTCSEPEDDHCTTVGESYADLVIDLTKTCPNPEYEHFESFAHALYCKECEMILQPEFVNRIPCKSLKFLVRQDGTGVYVHTKCVKLDVTEHVRSTANECGNWAKKTYWRLWSECHFLSCRTCGQPYPVKNSAMCRYHPERAEYAPIGNLNLEQPTGRYPCCGERTFRFQVIKNPFGCKFRMHVPNVENDRDVRIKEIVRKYPKLTTVEPPTLNYDRNITTLVNLDSETKILNPLHWCVKLTLGENRLIDTSIMSSIWNLIDNKKKQKKFKDLNKRRKKILFELRMLSELNSKRTNINLCTNSNPMSTNDELEFTTFSKDYSWKIISIQELQREHESVIFNHITVNYNKSASQVNNHLSKPFNTPRNIYTAIHSKMLKKIKANKTMPKTTKTIKTGIS